MRGIQRNASDDIDEKRMLQSNDGVNEAVMDEFNELESDANKYWRNRLHCKP